MAGTTRPVLWVLCGVWVTVTAISVETPPQVLRAARGRSIILPCTYRTSVLERKGFILWDKLLWSHSERVLAWTFSTKDYNYGKLYENRVNLSGNAEESDASIIINQLTMDDNGTYECSVSLLNDLDGISKARVRLLVLVPPSKPDCSILGDTVIGNDIQLTCQSKEGSPAPQYRWQSFNLQNQERKGPPVAESNSGGFMRSTWWERVMRFLRPRTLESLRKPWSQLKYDYVKFTFEAPRPTLWLHSGAGHTLTLRNISTDMSGYYVCTSSNEVGTESCNITLTVRPPSMNVALYAGIAGGVVAALIIIGVLVYCCCCREKGEDQETRPNRSIYREPPEQLRELPRGREEEDDSRRQSSDYAAHV